MDASKSIRTKARILQAAVDEFIDKGLIAFTIQGVAQRASIAAGNLTYHFPSRDVLVAAMITFWAERWNALFDDLLVSVTDAGRDSVPMLIEWMIDTSMKDDKVRAFTELWARANHDPATRKLINQIYDTAIDRLVTTLGVNPASDNVVELRNSLYLLFTIVAGAAPVLGHRPDYHLQRIQLKVSVRNLIAPVISSAVERARSECAA